MALEGYAKPAPIRLARFPRTSDQNPYQPVLYRHLRQRGFELVPAAELSLRWLWQARREVSLLHFHWRLDRLYARRRDRDGFRLPQSLRVPLMSLRVAAFAFRLLAARLLGYRIAWTLHEIYPKNRSASRSLDRLAAGVLARLSHVLMAHDDATVARARREFGRRAGTIAVVPHGSYIGIYPIGRPRGIVRDRLNIPASAFVFLCFGSIRPDKEVELLLDAFRGLERPDLVLIIAGKVRDHGLGCAVMEAARTDPRIMPMLRFVPDSRVAELFGACDAAVLARGSGFTSGSMILALSLGCPVIAADVPAYRELTGDGSAGWLFRAGDADSLRATLEMAAEDPALAQTMGATGLERARRLQWSEAADRTAMLIAPPGL